MTSLQHGMRSNKMALRREDSYAFENRLRKWTAQLDPHGDIGEFLVYRTGVASESCTILPSRAIKEARTSGGMAQRSRNVRSPIAARRDRAGEQVSRRTGGNRGFAATERHAVGRLFRAFLPQSRRRRDGAGEQVRIAASPRQNGMRSDVYSARSYPQSPPRFCSWLGFASMITVLSRPQAPSATCQAATGSQRRPSTLAAESESCHA